MACIRHRRTKAAIGQLTDRLDQTQRAARRARLTHGQLPAGGIEGKVPGCGQVMPADEFGRLALAAKSQILDLHEADDRIIVIGLDEIHIFGANAGVVVKPVHIHGPTAPDLDRIVGIGVVPLDGGENCDKRQIQ